MASVSGSLHEQLRQWLGLYVNQHAVRGRADFTHYCLQQFLRGFRMDTGWAGPDTVVTLEGALTCLWCPPIWSADTKDHAGATQQAHL